MKLRDVINNIDKSKENLSYTEVDKILQDLTGNYLGYPEKECERLKSYFFAKSICTDTWVGWRAYFLDDEVVAISHQPYRKYDEKFQWVSKESVKKTFDYLMSLYEADQPKGTLVNCDLDKEIGEGHKVEYGENLLTRDVIHEPTGEKVVVTQTWGLRNCGLKEVDKWTSVKVMFKDGKEEVVSVKDILVPYSLNLNL